MKCSFLFFLPQNNPQNGRQRGDAKGDEGGAVAEQCFGYITQPRHESVAGQAVEIRAQSPGKRGASQRKEQGCETGFCRFSANGENERCHLQQEQKNIYGYHGKTSCFRLTKWLFSAILTVEISGKDVDVWSLSVGLAGLSVSIWCL